MIIRERERRAPTRGELSKQAVAPLRAQLEEIDSLQRYDTVKSQMHPGARAMAVIDAFVQEHKDRLPERIPAGPVMELRMDGDGCALAYKGQTMIPDQESMYSSWHGLMGILATSFQHQLRFE